MPAHGWDAALRSQARPGLRSTSVLGQPRQLAAALARHYTRQCSVGQRDFSGPAAREGWATPPPPPTHPRPRPPGVRGQSRRKRSDLKATSPRREAWRVPQALGRCSRHHVGIALQSLSGARADPRSAGRSTTRAAKRTVWITSRASRGPSTCAVDMHASGGSCLPGMPAWCTPDVKRQGGMPCACSLRSAPACAASGSGRLDRGGRRGALVRPW